jgi:hypothetical protein
VGAFQTLATLLKVFAYVGQVYLHTGGIIPTVVSGNNTRYTFVENSMLFQNNHVLVGNRSSGDKWEHFIHTTPYVRQVG